MLIYFEKYLEKHRKSIRHQKKITIQKRFNESLVFQTEYFPG